ncbi:MAG: type II toxin-antitoxin system PemK/MazF family toxin [Thermomicrobiales bacterium]
MSSGLPIAPRRGEVWLSDLEPVIGHEQGGIRPALVLSDDGLNAGPSRLVALIPITTRDRGLPMQVRVAPPEGGLQHPSVIMCEQTKVLSQLRLRRRLGTIDPATMLQVETVLRRLFRL